MSGKNNQDENAGKEVGYEVSLKVQGVSRANILQTALVEAAVFMDLSLDEVEVLSTGSASIATFEKFSGEKYRHQGSPTPETWQMQVVVIKKGYHQFKEEDDAENED